MTAVKDLLKSRETVGLLILAALIFVVLPLALDIFRLNLVGKYLTYAFVAVGLVLCWGYGGVLSLGQGVFFGLGGYCMAMFLKLEASDPQSTKIQSTPGIPDFMDWNQLTALPWFWQPFHSLTFSLIAMMVVPGLLAFIIGVAMFKRRVGGVYFAIITQAIAAILTILIIGQQGYTGGVNGMTDLKTLHGWDIRTDSAKYVLYYLCGGLLFATIFVGRFVLRSKLGKLLLAMRDKEERVRFSGYDVASFKVFVFTLAAVFSAIGGALFTLQVGFMSPSFVGIVPSIEMVIFTAVGGRASLLGAVYGSLVVNWAKTFFSESFPQLWLLFMGGLFIAVVMFFPNGLAGIIEQHGAKLARLWPGGGRGSGWSARPATGAGSSSAGAESSAAGSPSAASPRAAGGLSAVAGSAAAGGSSVAGSLASGSSSAAGSLASGSSSVAGSLASGSSSAAGSLASGSSSAASSLASGSSSVAGSLASGSSSVAGSLASGNSPAADGSSVVAVPSAVAGPASAAGVPSAAAPGRETPPVPVHEEARA